MATQRIAQVTLARDSGIPEDQVVNVWHFDGDDGAAETGLMDRIEVFYKAIQSVYASYMAGTGIIRLYNPADAKPRVPTNSKTFTFAPGGAPDFPAEIAICLSMRATYVSGTPNARRRGRVYIGPLSAQSTATGGAGSDVRPPNSTQDTILDAAVTMATGGGGSYRLSVFSERTLELGSSIADAHNDVVEIWTDDAFDTQRRRGGRATTRRTRAIT